ncbi:MAG: hypothetical protein RBS38_14080 [Bacteroidales bacterium]|jgi:hypothetical protein|nr:hypothetical protein [Bacteroidales bacterium]
MDFLVQTFYNFAHPLSRFPGGERLASPCPLGEGWEGGKNKQGATGIPAGGHFLKSLSTLFGDIDKFFILETSFYVI